MLPQYRQSWIRIRGLRTRYSRATRISTALREVSWRLLVDSAGVLTPDAPALLCGRYYMTAMAKDLQVGEVVGAGNATV